MDQLLQYLFANLNGATETAVLFILVFFDTFLGSLWRKRQGVARTSGGGLGGLITSIPLALMLVVHRIMTNCKCYVYYKIKLRIT